MHVVINVESKHVVCAADAALVNDKRNAKVLLARLCKLAAGGAGGGNPQWAAGKLQGNVGQINWGDL